VLYNERLGPLVCIVPGERTPEGSLTDQLIVAGFHRSGTSATAQLLRRAGLFLGHELLEALPSNPYGHFEDKEVVDLHHGILADNDLTWLVDRPFVPVVDGRRWRQMQELAERRNTGYRLWGFKDPRACLFLPLWKYLLPNAKVLLVYRHFSGSTYSLARRHSALLFSGTISGFLHRRFWEEPDLALRMWLVHNRALLAFARAHPEDTLAVSMDMIEDGFPLVWAVERRWNLGLEDVPVGEVFDPAATVDRPRRQPVSDRRIIGEVEDTWRSLEELGARTARMLEETTIAG
jgi:hypothetical protein